MKNLTPRILLLATALVQTGFIVIRHDKSEAEYLELAKKFPQVCKVGLNGGDATLIAPTWVLTAAHVADGISKRDGKNMLIYFDNDRRIVKAAEIFIHPEFVPMGDHDIALIKLAEPVTDITPADLYKASDEEGKEIVIVGHGDFKNGNETQWKGTGKKRAATNRIDKVSEDQIIFDFDSPEAGATTLEGSGAPGDSGGPAFITDQGRVMIAGVSSTGRAGAKGPGTYGATEYYTRVSTHIPWIEDVLKGGKVTLSSPQPAPAIEGLGIFLLQGDQKIIVEGKIDPQVPVEFRHILFNPQPSYISSLNGKKYTSLTEFKKAFLAIKPGSRYTIEFSVRGDIKKFEVVR